MSRNDETSDETMPLTFSSVIRAIVEAIGAILLGMNMPDDIDDLGTHLNDRRDYFHYHDNQ